MIDHLNEREKQVKQDRLADECTCRTCSASTADRNGPRVVSAVSPRPGESLIGLISRAGHHNHLPNLRTLLGACTLTSHAHINLATRDDVDFGQLAHAARVAPHDINSRRYPRFVLGTDLDGVDYHDAKIPEFDLELRFRRFAPSWLDGEPFHCALGHHALATHCPISGDLLIDRCQRCKARLHWSGLDLSRCGVCDYDLRTAEAERVSERELISTRLMLDLVHPDPARHSAAAGSLPELLVGLDRGAVFELGWRFGDLLSSGSIGRRNIAKRSPVATRLRILDTGSRVLATWPDSIRSALQGSVLGSDVIDRSLPRVAGSLAKAKNTWPAVREAIFAAIPGLAVSTRTGIKSVLPKPANGAELTRSLGVSQRVFERMRKADIFSPVSASGAINLHQIFDATEAEHLQVLFADRTPLTSVSERLGISVHGAEQLCCLGELHLLTDDALAVALKHRHITMSSLDNLQNRLEQASACSTPKQTLIDPVPIRRALRSIGGREKPWGPPIVALLTGGISFAIDRDKAGRVMDRITIPAGEVHQIAATRFDPTHHPDFAFTSRIGRRDFEELLNINSPAFSRAVDESQIPTKTEGTYDRDDALRLAMRTLSVSEALTRWGYGRRRLPDPLKKFGAAIRLGKLGWDRVKAEQVMAESPVSFSALTDDQQRPRFTHAIRPSCSASAAQKLAVEIEVGALSS